MRRALFSSCALLLLAATAAATADGPSAFASTLRKAGDCASDSVASAHAHHWAAYYEGLRAHATVVHRGATVDCVSFMDQPALVEAAKKGDTQTLGHARAALLRSKRSAAAAADQQSAQCPAETVPLTRPAVHPHATKSDCPVLTTPAPKRQPSKAKASTADVGGYAYQYVLAPFTYDGSNSTQAWGVFGVGTTDNALPAVTAGDSHAINQLWWTTTQGRASDTVTLEGGWITSSYWSSSVETALFVFSTPDDYTNTSSNGPDQYNQAGGFVQYPGTPSLGTGRDSVQYQLMYKAMPNNGGFEAYLRPFTQDSATGSYSFSEAAFPFGYYPMQRYIWGQPAFTWFQVGSESCIQSSWLGPAQVQASGTIHGWGFGTSAQPIDNNFSPTDSVYSASYASQTWTDGSQWVSADSVHFLGDNKPSAAATRTTKNGDVIPAKIHRQG